MSAKLFLFHVDHGFCALVKSPNGKGLLIDCGARPGFSPIRYIADNIPLTPHRNSWKEYHLAKFILTHPHDDHLTDIKRMKKFPPAVISRQKYEWDDIKEGDEDEYENLDTYAAWQETYNSPADTIDWGGMTVIASQRLSPQEAKELDEKKYVNNSSIPVVVEVQGVKITFGGDLETIGWQKLLERKTFRDAVKGTEIFVPAHHGHSSGFCEDLYNEMGVPLVNLVSTSWRDLHVDNRYSSETYARGITLSEGVRRMFTTRRDGTIQVEIQSDGRRVWSWGHLDDNV